MFIKNNNLFISDQKKLENIYDNVRKSQKMSENLKSSIVATLY